MPEVLSTARGRRPRAVLKTKGTVFSHTDRPSPVSNFFFSGRLLFKIGKEIGIKDIAYVASRVLKGTVSQTAHVQVISQKWSDVFKFVICETRWRRQAEDNPHSHGGRRNNSGRKKFF